MHRCFCAHGQVPLPLSGFNRTSPDSFAFQVPRGDACSSSLCVLFCYINVHTRLALAAALASPSYWTTTRHIRRRTHNSRSLPSLLPGVGPPAELLRRLAYRHHGNRKQQSPHRQHIELSHPYASGRGPIMQRMQGACLCDGNEREAKRGHYALGVSRDGLSRKVRCVASHDRKYTGRRIHISRLCGLTRRATSSPESPCTLQIHSAPSDELLHRHTGPDILKGGPDTCAPRPPYQRAKSNPMP